MCEGEGFMPCGVRALCRRPRFRHGRRIYSSILSDARTWMHEADMGVGSAQDNGDVSGKFSERTGAGFEEARTCVEKTTVRRL